MRSRAVLQIGIDGAVNGLSAEPTGLEGGDRRVEAVGVVWDSAGQSVLAHGTRLVSGLAPCSVPTGSTPLAIHTLS